MYYDNGCGGSNNITTFFMLFGIELIVVIQYKKIKNIYKNMWIHRVAIYVASNQLLYRTVSRLDEFIEETDLLKWLL